MPEVTSVKACCGAALLYGFGGKHDNVYNTEFNTEATDTWLANNEAHQKKAMGMALTMITLNDAQMDEFGEFFKERGYKFSDPAYHPKHRTRIYVGVKALHEDPEDIAYFKDDKKPLNYGNRDTSRFSY